jgi:3-deoxy-D-manno-octulosonic-acid transferase
MPLNTNYKGKILYGLYNIVWLLILLPVAAVIFWRYRQYSLHNNRFGERLTFYNNKIQPAKIWLHTASVGEVNAALPLLRDLISTYGVNAIVVTTTTPTGESVLKKAFGERLNHCYLPFDQCLLMRRFINKFKLQAVILFETEIWPSLIVEASQHNVKTILINARMSDKSKQKYLKFASLTHFVLNKISLVVAQTEKEAEYFNELGAESCKASDSLKFAINIDERLKEKITKIKANWLTSINNKKIIIAASTHPKEEHIILQAFKQLQKVDLKVLLILVPRHVERSDEVRKLCTEQKLSLMIYREDTLPDASIDVVLVDVVGKLFELFGLANIAIMGGTFINHGGQNFLEPAVWGLPVVSGKSDYNFSEIAGGLIESAALTQVDDIESLTNVLKNLLSNEPLAKSQGEAAKQYSLKNNDAAHKMMSIITALLPSR